MAVHFTIAGNVFTGVINRAVPRDVLDEIRDRTESVPENFPTYFSKPV